jgi:hypothetical protein
MRHDHRARNCNTHAVKTSIALAMIVAALPAFAQREEIPKSIAASVAGPLEFAERDFLAVAEAMPGRTPPAQCEKGDRAPPGRKPSCLHIFADHSLMAIVCWPR